MTFALHSTWYYVRVFLILWIAAWALITIIRWGVNRWWR